MNMLVMVFALGSDEDVAFEKRQLLEAHAFSYGFEVMDNYEALLGAGNVICVDKAGDCAKVKEFMSFSAINRLKPDRIMRVQSVTFPAA